MNINLPSSMANSQRSDYYERLRSPSVDTSPEEISPHSPLMDYQRMTSPSPDTSEEECPARSSQSGTKRSRSSTNTIDEKAPHKKQRSDSLNSSSTLSSLVTSTSEPTSVEPAQSTSENDAADDPTEEGADKDGYIPGVDYYKTSRWLNPTGYAKVQKTKPFDRDLGKYEQKEILHRFNKVDYSSDSADSSRLYRSPSVDPAIVEEGNSSMSSDDTTTQHYLPRASPIASSIYSIENADEHDYRHLQTQKHLPCASSIASSIESVED